MEWIKPVMGQAGVNGGWLMPVIGLVLLLALIVGILYQMRRRPVRSRRPSAPDLQARNEALKRQLAEIQARNEAELAQARAELEQAQGQREQVVAETRAEAAAAAAAEIAEARARLKAETNRHLSEFRREGSDIVDQATKGKDEDGGMRDEGIQ